MNRGGDQNRSVRNTKKKLRDELLRLMQTKSVNEITAKELAELADVNRGTFYFHYSDIYDLLHSIEDDFFAQLEQMLNAVPPPEGSALDYLTAIFTFIGQNPELCRVSSGRTGICSSSAGSSGSWNGAVPSSGAAYGAGRKACGGRTVQRLHRRRLHRAGNDLAGGRTARKPGGNFADGRPHCSQQRGTLPRAGKLTFPSGRKSVQTKTIQTVQTAVRKTRISPIKSPIRQKIGKLPLTSAHCRAIMR